MSSRHKHHYPTGWTKWEWSEEHGLNYRARQTRKDEWEYDYAPSHESTPRISEGPSLWTPRDSAVPHDTLPRSDEQRQPYEATGTQSGYYGVDSLSSGLAQTKIDSGADDARYQHGYQSHGRSSYQQAGIENDSKDKAGFICPTCSMIFTKESDFDRHHITMHVNEGARPFQCLIEGCSAGVRSWTTPAGLRSHEKSWHGLGSDEGKSETVQPLQPGSQSEPNESSARTRYSPQPRYIATRDSKAKYEDLDSRFKVHKSSEFKFGRIFKVLWSEPSGSGYGSEVTDSEEPAKYGERAYHKIRRFMIIEPRKGHSICIPILTYGYRGLLKNGVHSEDHAVVYSSRRNGPQFLDGEERLMTKRPIRVEIKDGQKLDPMSRLNYGKIYTVEHNVKVLFIGKVAENYEQTVVDAFNKVHPPLSSRPHPERPDSPDVYAMNGPGHDPIYGSATPIPTTSASYPAPYASPAASGYYPAPTASPATAGYPGPAASSATAGYYPGPTASSATGGYFAPAASSATAGSPAPAVYSGYPTSTTYSASAAPPTTSAFLSQPATQPYGMPYNARPQTLSDTQGYHQAFS